MIHADLVRVLEAACNGTGTSQEAGMLQLQALESRDDYMSGLCSVIADRSVHPDLRLLSVISLKNVVSRCWSSQRGEHLRAATDSEKQQLRAFVLRSIDETDKKVCRQLSALVSKLARADWPERWPELLPSLFRASDSRIHAPDSSLRALRVLNEAVEELRSKQLPGPRHALAASCLAAVPDLCSMWSQQCDAAAQCISALASILQTKTDFSRGHLSEVSVLLQQFSLCTAVAHKLLERSFMELARTNFELLRAFFERLTQQTGQFVSVLRLCLRSLCAADRDDGAMCDLIDAGDDGDGLLPPLRDGDGDDDNANSSVSREGLLRVVSPLLQRALKELVKIPVDLQKAYPAGMSPFVGPFLSFFWVQLQEECAEQGRLVSLPSLFSFRISSLLFLSNTLSCREYEGGAVTRDGDGQAAGLLDMRLQGVSRMEDPSQALAAARSARDAFFQGDTATSLLDLTLRHFLPYGRADLAEWDCDPEQFYSQSQAQQEDDTVRSAAEGLVLGLLSSASCGDIVTKCLVQLLNDVAAQAAAAKVGAPDADVVVWDSVFLCAGLGAYSVGQLIDATAWLRSILGPLWGQLLSDAKAGALRSGPQVLRHRLLWLLRCWFYQFDAACHADLLGLAASVLSPSNCSDIVVSMEACLLVETALDTCVLKPEAIGPVLVQLVQALVSLASRLTEPDLQATVVGVIAKLVQCMGYAIKPLVPVLVHQFSLLWQQSDSSSPLKPTILDALTELVKAARESVTVLVNEMAPLIAFACSGTNDSSFLLKEGISLWLALMRNLPVGACSESLDSVLRACLDGLFCRQVSELSADELRELMLICEAYAVLGGLQCLLGCAESLHGTFQKVLCEVSPRSVVYVVRPLEAFFLTCPAETALFVTRYGLLTAPVRACAASTTDWGVMFEQHKEADVAVIMYVSLLARVLLVDPRIIVDVCEAVSSQLPEEVLRSTRITGTSLFYAIVRLMIDKFDVCSYSRGGIWRRKLWVLALLALYPDHAALWQWFPEVQRLAEEVGKESAGQAQQQLVQSMSCEDAEEQEHGDRADSSFGDGEDGAEGEGPSEMQRMQASIEARGTPFSSNFGELLGRDMVQSTELTAIAASKRSALRAAAGEATFNQILSYTYAHN